MQVRFLLARFLKNFFFKELNNYLIFNRTEKKKEKLKEKHLKVRHSFSFVSLTSPFIVNNLKLNYLNIDEKKVFVKQSYILLTWFYYISTLDQTNSKKKLKISTLPSIRKIFTLTKSPMAHKNWSKEQYQLKYFKFKISFNSSFKKGNTVNSLNSAIFFSLIIKKNIFSFETNIFFLKYLSVFYHFSDNNFFNYHYFIRKNL